MSLDDAERPADAPALTLANCVNDRCPWSGKPVSADALTYYRGAVVGFCNPGCPDQFDQALATFDPLVTG